MTQRKRIPVALTVGGSDSGGGAGIQADLKTFAAHSVHGLSAITCITAQNPRLVSAVQPASTIVLREQLKAVSAFRPGAMKCGMLYSKALIDVTREFVDGQTRMKLVLDPVMIATSGSKLLKPSAVAALQRLAKCATLITPNIPETEALCGISIRDIEDQRTASRRLHDQFRCAVLVKGGHMARSREVADILLDGNTELLLTAPTIRNVKTHGTGCTLSAAIAANLALGHPLEEAVVHAKEFVTAAIQHSHRAGGFDVLNPFWK